MFLRKTRTSGSSSASVSQTWKAFRELKSRTRARLASNTISPPANAEPTNANDFCRRRPSQANRIHRLRTWRHGFRVLLPDIQHFSHLLLRGRLGHSRDGAALAAPGGAGLWRV